MFNLPTSWLSSSASATAATTTTSSIKTIRTSFLARSSLINNNFSSAQIFTGKLFYRFIGVGVVFVLYKSKTFSSACKLISYYSCGRYSTHFREKRFKFIICNRVGKSAYEISFCHNYHHLCLLM